MSQKLTKGHLDGNPATKLVPAGICSHCAGTALSLWRFSQGRTQQTVEGTIMRISILAALLIAAFALPAHAVEPVKSAAKGTATVAKGAAKGTATVAKGAAKGTAAAGRGVAHGARCVATLFHRCQ